MLLQVRGYSPIRFSTQEFFEAYQMGIESRCSSDNVSISEQELITAVLQAMLERWDSLSVQLISFEWSVGFLIGELHALFVPALRYLNDEGFVEYQLDEEAQEPNGSPATEVLISSASTIPSALEGESHATR